MTTGTMTMMKTRMRTNSFRPQWSVSERSGRPMSVEKDSIPTLGFEL